MSEPRIYVACLASYNAGTLHGKWIDANQSADKIMAEVQEMLKNSQEEYAEEWAIHDFEGFGSHHLSESEGFEQVSQLAEFISEHEDLGAELLSHFCGCLEDAKKAIEENHAGEHESVADFAQQLTEDTSEIPKHLEFYIDYERMGRDMELNGDIFTLELAHGEVHIFWNH